MAAGPGPTPLHCFPKLMLLAGQELQVPPQGLNGDIMG